MLIFTPSLRGEKRTAWKNKKKAIYKCLIYSLLFPKAALVSAEIRKEYIEIVLAHPMCFWGVAQCRWVWVELPQRGQHSHLLKDLSLSVMSMFSVVEFQTASKQRSSGKPFPELCTPAVFQICAIPWFDKETSQYLVVQNTFILTLRHNIILGFQQPKLWPKKYTKQLKLIMLRQRCNSSKIHFTSSKTLLQNSVCLNLQLVDLEIAGRNTLFYLH